MCNPLHLAGYKCNLKSHDGRKFTPPHTEKGAEIEWCRFLIEIKNKLNLGEGYYKLLIIINMFGNV